MKLKLIVASMGLLGFISPLLAASNPQAHVNHHTATSNSGKHTGKQMQAMHPATHGYSEYHHEEGGYVSSHPDYKDMGPPPCPPPEACGLTCTSIIMENMTQNIHRSLPNPCHPGWFDRIFLSGGINVDFGKWGNRNADIMGENYQRVSLNDAYINVYAVVNNWTTAFASISYNTATIQDGEFQAFFEGDHIAEYSSAYDNNVTGDRKHTLQLEQAYATVANFNVSPFFFQVGKQFQDFGRYAIHPITRSLTQVMSETLATSAKVGFIANGFNGSLYVFDDPLTKTHRREYTTNYGAALGWERPCEVLGWSIGAAFLYNLIGVNDVAYNVNQFNIADFEGSGYHKRVSGAALYADINSGPFTLSLRYTTALQRFDSDDLPEHGRFIFNPAFDEEEERGAKPWAAGIQADYSFEDCCCRGHNLWIGYQTSRQAAGLNLPKHRFLAGYGIEPIKNTWIGIEWDHDTAYNEKNGGSGEVTNLVTIRTSFKFG